MKNQTNNRPSGFRRMKAAQQEKKAKIAGENLKSGSADDLVVIRDAYSHKDYYMSIIDSFFLMKTEYIVMYNYVPDNGSHKDPELVIMRTEHAQKGGQIFYSIKDPDELERAFVCFMRRYYSSQAPNPRARNGVSSGDNN